MLTHVEGGRLEVGGGDGDLLHGQLGLRGEVQLDRQHHGERESPVVRSRCQELGGSLRVRQLLWPSQVYYSAVEQTAERALSGGRNLPSI